METLKRRLLSACIVGLSIAGLSATAAEAGGWHHGGHHGGHKHKHHRHGFAFGFAPTFVFSAPREREYVREYVPAPAPVYQPVPVYYPAAPVYQQPVAPVYQQPVSAQPAAVEFDQSYCREYENTAKIDGKIVKTYGTACRQADGTWKLVN